MTMEMNDLLLAVFLLIGGIGWWLYFTLQGGQPHKKFDEDEHEAMAKPAGPGLPHHRRKK